MDTEVVFTVLGGGMKVGASCYLLKLGSAFIMLDCGTGITDGKVYEPNFYRALIYPFMESMNSLGMVFISHAHIDHMGCLPKLITECPHVPIFMTEVTEKLIEYQLEKKNNTRNRLFRDDFDKFSLAIDKIRENIICKSYNEEIILGDYKLTMYKAGHIPGAAMLYIEYGGRKILYTGDFFKGSTAMTDGYIIPDGLNPDTLIMCGLHAKHPGYSGSYSDLEKALGKIDKHVTRGERVYLKVSQLSKGVELLKLLNDHYGSSSGVNISMDNDIYVMVRKMEKLNIPIFKANNYPVGSKDFKTCNIMIGTGSGEYHPEFKKIRVDFTLHEDYDGLFEFVKRLKPKTVIIVHCGKENNAIDENIGKRIREAEELDVNVIFAKEEEIYRV